MKRGELMIHGAHVMLYSRDADADRAFIRDVLGFASVDAGGGWLIFALPPAELGVHPMMPGREGAELMSADLYLMCDDLDALIRTLTAQRVSTTTVQVAEWGKQTGVTLPSGGVLGIYEPAHRSAIERR